MKDRVCECTGDLCQSHKGNCGEAPFSWSVEHKNKVLCVDCYEKFIANKDVVNAIATINRVADNPAMLKVLQEALKNAN